MRPRGFTLLETVVAGVLAAGVFYTLLVAYPTAMMSLRKGYDLSVASSLARREVEALRQQTFASLGTGMATRAPVMVDGTVYTVETLISLTQPDVKEVRVKVSWLVQKRLGSAAGQESYALTASVYDFKNP